ncbi:type II toxin-antitoxin system RelE/ParE family toxin [Saccharicrinis sp. FJH54]|uniref:type II toxin-antitoxin system RelE/ParE family toxin n=1 Tax=Saccharicrinis sp. FJH54 TaxID=3344665 RepID=UPI0035D473A8
MAVKKIIWSTRASIELKKILEFYNLRNKSIRYSLKLLNEIDDLTKSIAKNELIGRLTSNKHTRVIPLKVFLVFYETDPETIKIVSFWDNRQNKRKRLKI